MNCPNCHKSGDRVTDKRDREGNGLSGTKRRRECIHCGNRWTTVEITVIVTRGNVKLPAILNGNGNGHKPEPKPKPKPQKPVTAKARELRKKLAMALHRARCKAIVIEGEELLHDPALAEEAGPDEFEEAMET